MRHLLLAISLFSLPALADSAAGITWKMPAAWKAEAARPMRAATYEVPAAKGDTEGAECGVFFFGNGQGGSVQANLDRWVSQFEGAKKPEPKKEKIAGLEATRVELEGTYHQPNMMQPGSPPTAHAGYKLVAVIVEAPQGAVFFKLSGPKKTVDAAAAEFTKMVKGLSKS